MFDASSGVDSFGDLTLTLVGGNTLITWGTTDSLLVEGVRPNRIDASDFSFEAAAAAAAASRGAAAGDAGPGDYSVGYQADHGLLIG